MLRIFFFQEKILRVVQNKLTIVVFKGNQYFSISIFPASCIMRRHWKWGKSKRAVIDKFACMTRVPAC